MSLIFDIETNGLLDVTDKLHCIAIYDTETKTLESYDFLNVYKAVDKLASAKEVVGHNIVKFDLPAIQKIFPLFEFNGKVFDTMLMSKLVYPDIGCDRICTGNCRRCCLCKSNEFLH